MDWTRESTKGRRLFQAGISGLQQFRCRFSNGNLIFFNRRGGRLQLWKRQPGAVNIGSTPVERDDRSSLGSKTHENTSRDSRVQDLLKGRDQRPRAIRHPHTIQRLPRRQQILILNVIAILGPNRIADPFALRYRPPGPRGDVQHTDFIVHARHDGDIPSVRRPPRLMQVFRTCDVFDLQTLQVHDRQQRRFLFLLLPMAKKPPAIIRWGVAAWVVTAPASALRGL